MCALLSPSCAQSLCDFRLHGVSHDAASPMPVPSKSRVGGMCGRFFCECAIIFEIKGRFGIVVAISYSTKTFWQKLRAWLNVEKV